MKIYTQIEQGDNYEMVSKAVGMMNSLQKFCEKKGYKIEVKLLEATDIIIDLKQSSEETEEEK